MSTTESCKSRWRINKNERLREIRSLWATYQLGGETDAEVGCSIYEYGLCFDYVPADDDRPGRPGYWRWQLSWGGPADELRFFADSPRSKCWAVEYTFLDWYDGYSRRLTGKDFALLAEIWQEFFVESEAARVTFENAMDL